MFFIELSAKNDQLRGCGQMRHIKEHIKKIQEFYKMYKETFSGIKEIEMNGK